MQRYNLKYCKKNCDKVYFPCILREQLILKIMFEWLHFHKAILIQTCYQMLIQKGEINISKFFFTSLFNWVLDVLACLRAHMVGLLACLHLVCLRAHALGMLGALLCLRLYLIILFICVLLIAKIMIWQLKNSCIYKNVDICTYIYIYIYVHKAVHIYKCMLIDISFILNHLIPKIPKWSQKLTVNDLEPDYKS